jgi:plastocyanin
MNKYGYLAVMSALLVAFMIFTSCAAKSAEPSPTTPARTGTTVEILIENYVYVPAAITVVPGTTVVWTNKDSVQHTVTSRTSLFDSGLFPKDKEFSYTFNQKGTFEYYCIPHPYMVGKVIVE